MLLDRTKVSWRSSTKTWAVTMSWIWNERWSFLLWRSCTSIMFCCNHSVTLYHNKITHLCIIYFLCWLQICIHLMLMPQVLKQRLVKSVTVMCEFSHCLVCHLYKVWWHNISANCFCCRNKRICLKICTYTTLIHNLLTALGFAERSQSSRRHGWIKIWYVCTVSIVRCTWNACDY